MEWPPKGSVDPSKKADIMRIEIYIDSEDERANAVAAAHVVQNHPELSDADEISIIAVHHDNEVATVY